MARRRRAPKGEIKENGAPQARPKEKMKENGAPQARQGKKKENARRRRAFSKIDFMCYCNCIVFLYCAVFVGIFIYRLNLKKGTPSKSIPIPKRWTGWSSGWLLLKKILHLIK